MSQSILLNSPVRRQMALDAVRTAPECMEMTLRPKSKSRQQEKLFHARLTEFAKSEAIRARWGRHTIDEWKDEIVKAAFKVEVRRSFLDPERYIEARISTTSLSVAQYNDLIEMLYSLGASAGHVWAEYRPGDPHWEAEQVRMKSRGEGEAA